MSILASRATKQAPVLAATRRDGGDLGAYCCRSPLQYRHIAVDDPPKSASHIASVAHVPTTEIGSKPIKKKAATLCGPRPTGLLA